jgi:tetratricopeptide (TPR) repeat protein
MIEELVKRISDKLDGADFWIAACFVVAGVICWRLIGKTKKQEKKLLLRQIVSAIVLLILAVGFIWLNHRFCILEPIFSKNVTGILVTRMVGDDALNSLRGDLVGKLNAELQREAANQQIEVHAGTETPDESEGLVAAHNRARAIGQCLNANLVIWGRRIGEKKFYPRITVMAGPNDWIAAHERTRKEQNITELSLPQELVDEPFYLIHFAAGYSYFRQDNYKEALPHFEAALRRKGGSDDELADLQFFTAFCDYSLAAGQKDMSAKLLEAIELYLKAANVYKKQNNQDNWAVTQNNLGNAYGDLPAGDHVENLQKAIAAYEAALRVRTEKDFPVDWAMTQNNLGVVYTDLTTGDRDTNLQKAIAAFQAALRVRTERDFPVDWAMTQNNLGTAYGDLATGDPAVNLQKAIAAYEAALRVYNEKDFPVEWAASQNNLGNAYGDLETGDRATNLRNAIAAYEAALRVRTEKDFPVDWATTQHNLGSTYGNLETGDRAANLREAIAAYEAALQVRTEKDWPVDWAMTQNALGLTYMDITGGDRLENLKDAKNCFEAALRVYTERNFPKEHSDVAANLAEVENQFRTLAPQ